MKLRTRKDNKKRILLIVAIVVAVAALVGIIVGVVSLLKDLGIIENKDKYDAPDSIVRIHVMIKPKTEYFVNQEFDPKGIVVYVTTQDPDKSYTVDDVSKLTFEGFDSSEVTESLGVGVWYKGFKTEYTIEVKEFVSEAPVPVSIEVKDMILEYSVAEWQSFGPNELGAWILITYSDGSTRGSREETPLNRGDITGWDPQYNYQPGKTYITVSHRVNDVTYTTSVEITLK